MEQLTATIERLKKKKIIIKLYASLVVQLNFFPKVANICSRNCQV